MPRMINVICDAALLVGYAENARVIDVPLMQLAISELEASTVLRRNGATAPAATTELTARPIEPGTPPLREATLLATSQHTAPAAPVAAAATAARPSAPPDMRYRQPAARPDPAVRPRLVQTPPQRQQWTLQRSEMAHLAAPATRAAAHVQPTAAKPSLNADPDGRRTGGWGWVKSILLGFDPEAERR
jgi:hypothetical protein